MADTTNTERTQEELNELLKIRHDKLKTLQEAGNDPFHIVKADQTHHSEEVKANFDALEGQTVTVAGRLMSRRIMGKASLDRKSVV